MKKQNLPSIEDFESALRYSIRSLITRHEWDEVNDIFIEELYKDMSAEEALKAGIGLGGGGSLNDNKTYWCRDFSPGIKLSFTRRMKDGDNACGFLSAGVIIN